MKNLKLFIFRILASYQMGMINYTHAKLQASHSREEGIKHSINVIKRIGKFMRYSDWLCANDPKFPVQEYQQTRAEIADEVNTLQRKLGINK